MFNINDGVLAILALVFIGASIYVWPPVLLGVLVVLVASGVICLFIS